MKKLSLLFVLFCLYSIAVVQAQQAPMPPLVTVTGVGEIRVPPTEVIINLGVETRANTLEEARKETDKKAASIISYLKRQGVSERDIQTSYVTLQPMYTGGEFGKTSPDFYHAQKTMTVRVKRLNRFDDLLAGIYDAGVNQINGINFQVEDEERLKEQARRRAVADAKRKATVLTSELGARVGRVYAINEIERGRGPQPMYKAAMMEASYDRSAGPSIAGGEVVVSTEVNVSFLID